MQIVAKMSDVKMNITQAQYGFIISLSQSIPRAFSSDDDDDDYSLPPSRQTPSPLPVEAGSKVQGETVDLLPELGMIAKRADGESVVLKSSLELTFSVGTVYLEIFTADAITPESLKDSSIARFSLNETGVKYKMLSNGSIEAEVVVRSFTVHDTHTSRLTKFREIIPATSHDGHQFMINYTQSGGLDQSAFANVTVDSPKVIFSLEPVFAISGFFTSAFHDNQSVIPRDPADDEPITPAPAGEGKTFAFRVNVVSPTIILLDNPEAVDSAAGNARADCLQDRDVPLQG